SCTAASASPGSSTSTCGGAGRSSIARSSARRAISGSARPRWPAGSPRRRSESSPAQSSSSSLTPGEDEWYARHGGKNSMAHRLLAGVALGLVAASVSAAADRGIAGTKLVLQRSAAGHEKLVFVSKDPGLLFPAIGSADDPSGLPGGAEID